MYNNGNSSKNVTGSSVVDGTLESADYADNGLSGDKIDGGIISNFQSTGIDDNSNALAMTIDSNERVIIGKTTTIAPAQADDLSIGSTSGSHGLTIVSNRANTGNLYFHDNDNNDSGAVIYDHSTNAMAFRTNRGTRASFDSAGYLRLNAGGIQFNGDTAAANALDDYEEGTWTPALSVESGTTPTYTVTKATYTKIGRLVTCKVKIAITAAGSGLLRMTYPFVPAADQQLYGVANLKDSTNTYQGLTVVSYNNTYVYFRPDNSTVYYFKAQHLNTDLNLAFSFEV